MAQLLMSNRRSWRSCLFAGRQFIINSMSSSKNNFNFLGAVADVGFQSRIFYSSDDGQNSRPPPKADQTYPKLSKKSNYCLRVKRLSDKAIMPSRASASPYGYLLFSARDIKVPARDKAWVPTDLRIGLEEKHTGHICPHSSTLAKDHAIDVGYLLLEYHYRGRIYVPLFNHSDVDYQVKVGDTIAQLLVLNGRVGLQPVTEVEELD